MDIVSGVSFELSSDYVEASSLFTGESEIRVYVEGFRDIPFWTEIFRNGNFDKKVKVIEASRDCKSNGKDVIISMFRSGSLDLGPYLLIALDSDYDYLLDNNPDVYSQDFCFQTYCYSIENFYYYPSESLVLCCQAANCFEFVDEFRCLSDVFTHWSRNNFEQFILFLSSQDQNHLEPIYESLRTLSLDSQIQDYSFVEISPELTFKGAEQDNLFLFIRGHNFEVKCSELFRGIFEQITQKKKEQINSNPIHSEAARRQLITEFCRSRTQIESILRTRNISINPFFSKIISDISLFKHKYF